MYKKEKFQLIAVTSRHLCGSDFLNQAERIAQAGFDRIILREKDMASSQYKELAMRMMERLEPYPVIVTLHNNPEAVAELQAESLHLPLEKAWREIETLRRESGRLSEIGFSIHEKTQLSEVWKMKEIMQKEQGLQEFYITAGHIFPTDCKKGLPPRGLSFLQEICETANMPVYAIGGITPENMKEVKKAGADGACLMSYCMKASEKELRELVRRREEMEEYEKICKI